MPPEMKTHVSKPQNDSSTTRRCSGRPAAGTKLLFPCTNPATPGNEGGVAPEDPKARGTGTIPWDLLPCVGSGLCFPLSVGRKTPFPLLLDDTKAGPAAGPPTVTCWCCLVP